MNDYGEKALEDFMEVLDTYLNKVSKEDFYETQNDLLSIHRVLLVLLELHERTMEDAGVSEDEIKLNKISLDEARRTIDEELDLGITMKGGDA